MQTFVGRNRARIEDTLSPPRRRVAVSSATELCCVDRVIDRPAAVGYHWELLAGFFCYVVTHSCNKIYVTQAPFEDRWSILGEPLGMQLQNYSSVGIKSAKHR